MLRHAGTGNSLADLFLYDPATLAWTDLSALSSGDPPSPRAGHGFASAGGKLYVHGGIDGSGEAGAGTVGFLLLPCSLWTFPSASIVCTQYKI